MTRKLVNLSITDHPRDGAGMTYCYPVLSRRAGGVSIGINLNTNNACNWRCIYCQVPDLRRGAAPPVDLGLLRGELDFLIGRVLAGDLKRDGQAVAAVADIALSGNGEPTSAREFAEVVGIAAEVAARHGIAACAPLRVITNGSLMRRASVQRGLDALAAAGGEAWFKIDSGTREGIRSINGVDLSPDQLIRNLRACAEHCRTWIQTCLFRLDGKPPAGTDFDAYLDVLARARELGIAGVMLYGIARESHQPEADRLDRLDPAEISGYADLIRRLGLAVRDFP